MRAGRPSRRGSQPIGRSSRASSGAPQGSASRRPSGAGGASRGRPGDGSGSGRTGGAGGRAGSGIAPGALDPAGRHANGAGDGFGRLVGFTVLGAAVPGAGLVAAGRRKTGWAIIALLVAAVATAVALVVTGRAQDVVVRFGTRPGVLLGVAVGVGVVAAAWCAVIVASHLALRRHRTTGGQQAIAVLLVAALMGLVAVPAATASRYALSARSTLTTVFSGDGASAAGRDPGAATPAAKGPDPWAKEPRVNVLLLGSDLDAEHTGIRPDTLIVASIDTRTGDTVLISLPRNLQRVPFPPGSEGAKEWPDGWGPFSNGQRILNAVWGDWGQAHPDYYPDSKEPGLAATRSVVSTIIGMPIDYSVVVNIDGFRDFVDAMGGLTVDVPKDLPIGGGYNLDRNGNKVPTGYVNGVQTFRSYPVDGYVKAGKDRQLDGYEALWFARSRWMSDDFERINRQRCVLQDAVEQYTPAKIAQAFPAIAATANQNIETDIQASEIPAFVTLGERIKKGNLTSLAFTSDVIDTADPDYPKMRDLIQQALLDSDGQAQPAPGATSATPPPAANGEADPLAAPKGSPIVDTASVCG